MKGQCLCGAVSVEATDHAELTACHCGMCQRWGGGPLMTVHCIGGLRIDGLDAVAVYKSSDWAERAFCKHCGTHLYYRLVPANEYVVPAGLLQQKPALRFVEQIYVDVKPPYYRFADQTRELTEAEVLAKYGVP